MDCVLLINLARAARGLGTLRMLHTAARAQAASFHRALGTREGDYGGRSPIPLSSDVRYSLVSLRNSPVWQKEDVATHSNQLWLLTNFGYD